MKPLIEPATWALRDTANAIKKMVRVINSRYPLRDSNPRQTGRPAPRSAPGLYQPRALLDNPFEQDITSTVEGLTCWGVGVFLYRQSLPASFFSVLTRARTSTPIRFLFRGMSRRFCRGPASPATTRPNQCRNWI